MGRHVPRALLVANKKEAWDFVGKLLVAAQRQEGLRQVILETVDEAHPEAFTRILRLLSEEKLSRFAAVVRAVDVWFGFGLETSQGKRVDAVIKKALLYLEHPEARTNLLSGTLVAKDAEDVYLATLGKRLYRRGEGCRTGDSVTRECKRPKYAMSLPICLYKQVYLPRKLHLFPC